MKLKNLFLTLAGLALTATASAALQPGTTLTNESASVTWPFNSDTDYEAVTVAPEGSFSITTVDVSAGSVVGTGTVTVTPGVTFVKIKPNNSGSDPVMWTAKPAKGLTFTPTRVFAYITRFGTDAENGVKVSARMGNGDVVELGTFTAIRNNKDYSSDKYGSKATDHFDITLTADQQAKLSGPDGFTLIATIGVGNSKEGGFSNVIIEGNLNGTVEAVEKYTLTTSCSPLEGGSIEISPAVSEMEAGTPVTVTAVRNFGYKFINWTDASGKVVSEEPVYKFEINANTSLIANFQAIPTWALNLGVEGGANDYQVQPVPAPTVIDGKNMYEDGTKVSLTAISNPLLTFTNWSDGQSSSEITVTMDSDKDYVASFSAIDYIVGWDFYQPGTGRAADFYSADNDNVSLSLRNAEGNIEGWLDKSQVGAGGYEGRPAAVNWRTYGLGKYYWQTKVNASAFKNIKVITAMAYNFNAYTVQNVDYSLDGNSWTTLGSITINGAKNWTDAEFNLPAAANNASELYIRFISDTTSPVDGTSSNNDGIALGATYIIGDVELINDGKAPVLVSFVPEEGNSNASINGKIVLNFDEKVKVKEGAKATLAGQQLEPSVSGKTVMFQYKNLIYGTNYKFELAANTIADLTDNYMADPIVINFTTKTRPVVAKALYDFIVPDNGALEEAIAAADAREDNTQRFRIFIRNGNYVLPESTTATKTGTGDKQYPDPTTYVNTPNVSFIGESMDGVVITNKATKVLEGIGTGDVLDLNKNAVNTYMQNLTLKSNMGDGNGRDIVLNDKADKTILKDVCLWAYQDTYVSNNDQAKYYFEGGVIRGRTDYICGKGDVFFNSVKFRQISGGYLAVPSVPRKYGYILKDCTITGDADGVNGSYTLGRPWGKGTPIALYIDTRMEVIPSADGWNEMSGGWPARFAEYNSTTSSGTVIDLSSRKTTFGDGYTNNPVLTKEEADANNYYAVMGDGDDWDPASLAEQAPAATTVALNGSTLTWDNNDYALLWAVVKNDKVVAFVTVPEYTVDDPSAVWAVRAANEMGGLGEAVKVGQSGIDSIISDATANVVATEYYNVEGIRVNNSFKGFVIKVDTLSDGSKVSTKTILK